MVLEFRLLHIYDHKSEEKTSLDLRFNMVLSNNEISGLR